MAVIAQAIRGWNWGPAATTGGTGPQLQFFENLPGKDGAGYVGISQQILSVHAVNIPLSVSFNYPVILLSHSDDGLNLATRSFSFGLYSMNGSTLSLANSASGEFDVPLVASQFFSWHSLATSATQNISPGPWYFALNFNTAGVNATNFAVFGNSSINPGNAVPGGFLMGRMTAATTAMPASIATSDLDITASDALRQPYVIITA